MKTNFNPLTHGYNFANRFEINRLNKFSNLIKNKLIYGMCGGMVFTALDHYFDQKKIPKFTLPTELSNNYTKYLWKRQTESVSFLILMKIIYFSLLPKKVVVRISIQNELPKIVGRLSDSLPVPLVIVRSNLFQNPTHNHQVLVTQVEDYADQVKMGLYDPNHPLIVPSILIDKKKLMISQTTGEKVRGIFVNKYNYQSSMEV